MRIVRIITVFLAAIVAVALVQPRALASPKPIPQSQGPSNGWKTAYLSHSEWDAVKRGVNVYTVNDSRTLDYRIAIAKYKTSPHPVNWRRQFAAGWLKQGPISHISSSELAAVKRVQKNMGFAEQPLGVHPDTPNCTGVSKKTSGSTAVHYYFNSCQTTNAIYAAVGCIPLIGLFLGRLPGIGGTIVQGLGIAGCVITGGMISAARDNSSVHAIIVDVEDHGWTRHLLATSTSSTR